MPPRRCDVTYVVTGMICCWRGGSCGVTREPLPFWVFCPSPTTTFAGMLVLPLLLWRAGGRGTVVVMVVVGVVVGRLHF